MTTNSMHSRKAIGGRPVYMQVGRDAHGASHVYHTPTETVYVIQDGVRVHRESLAEHSIQDWIGFVATERGWTTRQFTEGLASQVSERSRPGETDGEA